MLNTRRTLLSCGGGRILSTFFFLQTLTTTRSNSALNFVVHDDFVTTSSITVLASKFHALPLYFWWRFSFFTTTDSKLNYKTATTVNRKRQWPGNFSCNVSCIFVATPVARKIASCETHWNEQVSQRFRLQREVAETISSFRSDWGNTATIFYASFPRGCYAKQHFVQLVSKVRDLFFANDIKCRCFNCCCANYGHSKWKNKYCKLNINSGGKLTSWLLYFA